MKHQMIVLVTLIDYKIEASNGVPIFIFVPWSLSNVS